MIFLWSSNSSTLEEADSIKELSLLILYLYEEITNYLLERLYSVTAPLAAMNNLNRGRKVTGNRMMKLVA